MLDQDHDDESLDLDLAPGFNLEQASPPGGSGFPQHIFRAYDIRGNAKTDLTDELITRLARRSAQLPGKWRSRR